MPNAISYGKTLCMKEAPCACMVSCALGILNLVNGLESASMGTTVESFIRKWRDAVEGGDTEKIFALLSNQMTFYSPVLFKPSNDRAYIDAVLRFVDETLSDFEYTEIYVQPQGAAMIFRAKAGDLTVEGADFFKLDEDGKVTEMKVMIRPLTAAMALGEAMKDHFAAMTDSQGT